MPSTTRAKYSPVQSGIIPTWSRQSSISWPKIVFLVFGSVTISFLSFALGRYSASSSTQDIIDTTILSLPRTFYTFQYNRTFAEGSETADRAWKTLFPKQNGYFTHPQIAPHRSTFSVYHSLHCLDGIRQGYWAVHDIAFSPPDADKKQMIEGDLPVMISPPHVRHCIDLLRQNLICNADLTVEVKDDAAGGVHGFGTSHRCVDWSALQDWVKKWEDKPKAT